MSHPNYDAYRIYAEIRSLSLDAIRLVPYLGRLSADVIDLLWPSGKIALWNVIVADMQKALTRTLREDFAKDTLETARSELQGLQNVCEDYRSAINDPDVSTDYKKAKYFAAIASLENGLPSFQKQNYETLLLPLFVQVVNLNIGILCDGAFSGDALGLSDHEQAIQQQQLEKLATDAQSFVFHWFEQGKAQAQSDADAYYGPDSTDTGHGHDSIATQKWTMANEYNTYMTYACHDIAHLWPAIASGRQMDDFPPNEREVYLMAGQLYRFPPTMAPPSGEPYLRGLRLFGWDDFDAVQQRFAEDWGPRMGDEADDRGGGSDAAPHGWNGSISADNKIARVLAAQDGWINKINLTFEDGSSLPNWVGGNSERGFPVAELDVNPSEGDAVADAPRQVVARFWSEGQSTFTRAANCLIVAFRYADSYR